MKRKKSRFVRLTVIFTVLAACLFDFGGAGLPVSSGFASEALPEEIVNPDFETGDLTGWTVQGEAFGAADVTDQATYWDVNKPFNHHGQYHLWGFKDGEDGQTGILESSHFRLAGNPDVEGSGRVSFLIGGGKNQATPYVALVRASDGKELFKATGPDDEAYTRVIWEASEYIGQELFFRVVDQEAGGFGHLNVDDFRTKLLPTTIENPGFESGNLTGWTIAQGDAFNGAVTDASTYWGGARRFEQQGTYHLWGFAGASEQEADARTGVLESSRFEVAGTGVVSFLIGGGQDGDNLYAALVRASDGQELFKATGTQSETYSRVEWDAKEYLGEEVYVRLVDRSTGEFGHLNFDDFRTNVVPAAESGRYTIPNPDFETGDLRGWTAEGDAFTGTVTNRSSYWDENLPFNQQGTYHVWGYSGAPEGMNPDSRTGSLTSGTFVLGGSGTIDFLIGGAKDPDNLYVALIRAADGAVLMKETGPQLPEFESYRKVSWNASKYLGEEVYLKITDQSTTGHINVDGFNVYVPGVIGGWSFDEGSGQTAEDSVTARKDPIDYVFNQARYKPSNDPQRRKGIKGNALLFDGYSTWVTRKGADIEKPQDALTIEAWVAPRSYEWGDEHRLSAIVNQHDRENRQGYILGMYRHGSWSMQLGLNQEWVEAWSNDHPLAKNKWNYVVATYDRELSKIKLYLNGVEVASQDTPRGAPITPSDRELVIGQNNQGVLLAGTFTLNMFNGVIDEVRIHDRAMTAEEIKASFEQYLAPYGGQIPSIPQQDLAWDRNLLAADRYRPQYHLTSPGQWMNEPHAPIYFNGQYHLFYQFNPQGPYWHQIHWGHWVSPDMVHWRDAGIALAPENNNLDPDGDWSGSATYDESGIPALFFTAGNDSASPNQRTGLARSTYPQDGDNDLTNWAKHPVPVTVQEPGTGAWGQFRDPFVFKDGDEWVQLVSSGLEGKGGTVLVYASQNMTDWEYKGPLYESDYLKYPYLGKVWELPVLLPVGKDKDGKQKHIFLISPVGEGADVEVYYWIGTWNHEAYRFTPDQEEAQLIDVGDFHFTGPSGMVDPVTGRAILFTIAQGERTPQVDYDSGWAHGGGLPVQLFLREDGKLGVEPIAELQSLRNQELASFEYQNLEQANELLRNIKGDMLEMIIEFEPGSADQYGIKVLRSPQGEEETLIYYDAKASTLNVNRDKTTLDPDARTRGIQGGKLELAGENLRLHLFLDRSMIEAYANGLKSLTTRAYPSRYDALGLQIWANGTLNVKSMQVWSMNSAFGETIPAFAKPERPPYAELANHDFATGDLTGWTVVSGNTFSDGNVTDRNDWGWGGPFNPSGVIPGKYHLWGIRPGDVGDEGTGELHSQNFILGGDGQIDFLIGGGKDPDKLYVALVRTSDGKELMKSTGNNYEMYQRKFWNASAYIGEELFIKIVDQSTGGWGHINIDDVNVPVKIEVSLDGLMNRVRDLAEAGALDRSLEKQLTVKLGQAKHQLEKGNKRQVMKHVDDCLKLLEKSDAGGPVKSSISMYAGWLSAEWSK
ncbi:GH32 C-terminal domain-containing protein [Paenibacillus caui]|uniref:GH32 C-terminal domain-containing protein n=1 Tax=Paenibacillus caui TaxID=2873927 RepID=UPI001CA91C20|nr:GH32 C-terminal domain-containing protein [Paenibacillus caui]